MSLHDPSSTQPRKGRLQRGISCGPQSLRKDAHVFLFAQAGRCKDGLSRFNDREHRRHSRQIVDTSGRHSKVLQGRRASTIHNLNSKSHNLARVWQRKTEDEEASDILTDMPGAWLRRDPGAPRAE